MFAPLGYVSFCEVFDYLQGIMAKFEHRVALPFYGSDPEKGIKDSILSGIFIRNWLLSQCLIQGLCKIYICNPSGDVMKISPLIAFAVDHYSFRKIDWPPHLAA